MNQKSSAVSLNQFSAKKPTQPTEEFPAFTPVLSQCIHFIHKLPAAHTIPVGTSLLEQGSAPSTVQLIESGLVKLVHVSASGREITIGLRSDGWYAGYTAALLGTAQACSVTTVTPCRVVRIPASDFSRWLAQDPEMLDHFVSVMCQEVAAQVSLQVEVMSSSAEDRLDHFMRERLAKDPSRRTLDPLPALKQMELAQLLAVTPEHLSRMMKKKKNASRRISSIRDQAFAGTAKGLAGKNQVRQRCEDVVMT